jgi:arginase
MDAEARHEVEAAEEPRPEPTLVRVAAAWGTGGEAMAAAADTELPFPTAARVAGESTLERHASAVRAAVERAPGFPLVLGGCCCSHVGAVEALAARHGRVAVIWFDAHGDLNTPETSPSGNEWGMPLRILLDAGVVAPGDVALVGARNLDPPEVAFIDQVGIHASPRAGDAAAPAVEGTDAAYVALDVDVLAPGELEMFMPEPGGPTLADLEHDVAQIARVAPLVGAGITGARADPANVAPLSRLVRALAGERTGGSPG